MNVSIVSGLKDIVLFVPIFNVVLRRCVDWIKSSLFLKIQWKEHHYLYKLGCYSVEAF